jgi:cytochrome c553
LTYEEEVAIKARSFLTHFLIQHPEGINMKKQLIGILGLLALTGLAQAAGDVEAGKAKAATCVACHMMDGNSVNPPWPKLAGQHADYLKTQMAYFKSNARVEPLMAPMVAPLSEEDMDDLAAFFSTQVRTPGQADPAQVELGERLYRAGNSQTGVAACSGCHGPAGNGNPGADFPSLHGQHAAYMEKALKDFRSGTRTTDPNKMMRDIAAKLSDAEIAAVTQYIQGLH